MSLFRLLAGTDFITKNPAFNAGTLYLDTNTGQVWFDDPLNSKTEHKKVVDTTTLIYSIIDSFDMPLSGDNSGGTDSGDSIPPSSSTSETAKLGVAVLGTMKLGTE